MDRKRFFELLEPVVDLLEKKHADYDAAGVRLEDYFPFGHGSYVQMMHVKTLRLVSLVKERRPANFEPIEDTLKDLVNYAVFYLDFLDKRATDHELRG